MNPTSDLGWLVNEDNFLHTPTSFLNNWIMIAFYCCGWIYVLKLRIWPRNSQLHRSKGKIVYHSLQLSYLASDPYAVRKSSVNSMSCSKAQMECTMWIFVSFDTATLIRFFIIWLKISNTMHIFPWKQTKMIILFGTRNPQCTLE